MKHQGRITIDDETEVFTKPGGKTNKYSSTQHFGDI